MTDRTDILDLDAIAPIPKFVKMGGKQYQVNPLTMQQLIDLERLEQALLSASSMAEVKDLATEIFGGFIPAIKEEGLFFTTEQMWAIIRFAQKTSIPQQAPEAAEVAREYAPKKKDDSLRESQPSSDSTQATK